MNIPKYNDLFRPVLAIAANKNITRRGMTQDIAEALQLTEEQVTARIPSGSATYIGNRVGWAMTFLTKATLIKKVAKATYGITELGKEFLVQYPDRITTDNLETIDGYVEAWETKRRAKQVTGDQSPSNEFTPEELIEGAMETLNSSVKSELLAQLHSADPYFFEQIVIDVLVAMGYGGSRSEAAKVTRKSNDGGIDGIINEDRLGLDVIYVQAKRYQANVGRNDVQNFVGALAGNQAHKGIFITTSDYIDSAVEYAKTVPQKVILVNGSRLADLMIEHNVGVSSEKKIVLKRVDMDYFGDS